MSPETAGSGEHAHAGHAHSHGDVSGAETSARRLALVAAINGVGFLLEVAGGLLFGSVALLGDAAHMLFDGLAYGMAFAAAGIAARYDTSDRWSFGLHRLEPLAAFLNGVLLVPMVAFILWESYTRVLDPVSIATGPTLLVAGGGLLINLASIAVLRGRAVTLNERGALYHLLGDAGASVAVIVSTVAVRYTGFSLIDPITAGLIAAVVLWSAWRLLRGSGAIFMQAAPVSRGDVVERLQDIEGVEGVVDCHAWRICSEITVATVQVDAAIADVEEVAGLTERIHEVLAEMGVDHATVEVLPTHLDRQVHLNSHGH
ncbi:MAG: cation diffusion facilitator family transporter [Halodesulfurarchaeum sp.]